MSIYDIACETVLALQRTFFFTQMNFTFNNNKFPHVLLLSNSQTAGKKPPPNLSCGQLWPAPVLKPVYYASSSPSVRVAVCVYERA